MGGFRLRSAHQGGAMWSAGINDARLYVSDKVVITSDAVADNADLRAAYRERRVCGCVCLKPNTPDVGNPPSCLDIAPSKSSAIRRVALA